MKYSAAGIRGRTLIVNLPGSEKAALENLSAVAEALCHGMDMLASGGSANCAGTERAKRREAPSLDAWLKEPGREHLIVTRGSDCHEIPQVGLVDFVIDGEVKNSTELAQVLKKLV